MYLNITIPADNMGYVLLQCNHCTTYFKLKTSDIEDSNLLKIYCPSCSLECDNCITADVIELAITMAKNEVMNTFYKEFKKSEKQYDKEAFSLKVGKKPKQEPEIPINSIIDSLGVTYYNCCHREAKIKPLLKMTGTYCPFCGVKNYELE